MQNTSISKRYNMQHYTINKHIAISYEAELYSEELAITARS